MIGDRWGVTDDEVVRRYPCDDLVTSPVLQLWRGVTVDAAPAEVWPWVCQVQLAPYSYDWLDNLGRRSPRSLQGVPDRGCGESTRTGAGESTTTRLGGLCDKGQPVLSTEGGQG